MLFQLPVSALLLALAVLADASSHGHRGAHLAHMRRRPLNPRGVQPLAEPVKRSVNRRSCKAKSSSSIASTHAATSTASSPKTVANAAPAPSSTTKKAAETTATTTTTKKASSPAQTEAVAAANFTPVKPADWPTATQSGPKPTSSFASPADPYLEELSKAYDNSGVDFFNQVHEGDMTYYGQGLGACGDNYDDNSFTAAVSHLMFDAWPGADSSAQNRNPICGPFVPGRMALNSQGLFTTAVKSSIAGSVYIGGDGLANCPLSVGQTGQCHIPLTATVTHGDKSIQVQIVDRCEGCKVGDIDLTPAAFAALADMSLGRTDVKWQFDAW